MGSSVLLLEADTRRARDGSDHSTDEGRHRMRRRLGADRRSVCHQEPGLRRLRRWVWRRFQSGLGRDGRRHGAAGAGRPFVFSPVKLTVTKGQTVGVKNVSSVSHTFTIQGKGIDAVNNGGQSQEVKIDLAPGTYTFVCRFHQSLGMQGTLIVKG